jgi:essential nuclear protein 1
MPKIPRPAQANERHNPLAEEYSPVQAFKQKAPKKRNRRDETEEDHVIDTKASRKILRIGQDLADEDEEERKARYAEQQTNPAFDFESRFANDVQSEEEEDAGKWDDEEAWGDEEEVFEVEVCTFALSAVLPFLTTLEGD